MQTFDDLEHTPKSLKAFMKFQWTSDGITKTDLMMVGYLKTAINNQNVNPSKKALKAIVTVFKLLSHNDSF